MDSRKTRSNDKLMPVGNTARNRRLSDVLSSVRRKIGKKFPGGTGKTSTALMTTGYRCQSDRRKEAVSSFELHFQFSRMKRKKQT
jgi:hypothetical protein